MKKLILIAVLFFVAGTFIECGNKNKKKAIELEKIKQDSLVALQVEFNKKLISYPSNECQFFEELIKKSGLPLSTNLNFVKVNPGKIEIVVDDELYVGETVKPVYAVGYNGNLFFPSGCIINDSGVEFTNLFSFYVEPLKSSWTRDELYPVLRKYPLSIRVLHDWGNTLETDWESFLDDPSDPTGYEIDPKGAYVIWKQMDPTIMNQKGKCWLTRKQSKERRN